MPKFDVGIEGELKFRINGIEAASGEAARDEIVRKFEEFIGTQSKLRVERVWFQPSENQPEKSAL